MNRNKVNRLLLCFGFMLFSLGAYAKKPPKPELGNAPPPPPPGLPIDGGLSLLLVSGVAYGIYELKRKK
ncbi:MAG: hypothetical protein CVU08_14130 [Bacteroidetes bacterium HGW-Bacteroidetes-3]|jgi:hypothetical protein|nr:MAG: hypothetical protein CVU08_14130 [Bacteroidetes bacterium HGW-Bacteroidetes-3]